MALSMPVSGDIGAEAPGALFTTRNTGCQTARDMESMFSQQCCVGDMAVMSLRKSPRDLQGFLPHKPPNIHPCFLLLLWPCGYSLATTQCLGEKTTVFLFEIVSLVGEINLWVLLSLIRG